MGRFEPKWDPLLLIAVMREVLAVADPDKPHEVSQRAYNEAREKAGHPDTPRADRLTKRFGVSWQPLVASVLSEKDQGRAISWAGMSREREVLTKAEVVSALRTVAARLGTTEFGPADYERARDEINAEVARRHLHGRAAKPLPSVHTLRYKMTFAEAMEAAGYAVPAARVRPLMSREQAITLFIEHCGFFPHLTDTAWFARTHGIQLIDKSKDPHGAAAKKVREAFGSQGRWCPPALYGEPKPEGWKEAAAALDTPELAAARASYPRSKREGYSLDELRAAIERAIDLLDPGEKFTEIRYRALHNEHGLIAPGVLHRTAKRLGSGFGPLVREAMAARVAAMKQGPSGPDDAQAA